MQWISARDVEAAGVRLFCLPHAGSGAAGFYRWKRQLPASVAVCPVALPGREARLGERSLERVEAIVKGLHEAASPWLDRPYAIFGHSMGALVAYEWAQRIAESGLPQPECLIVSGRNAPQVGLGHRGLHRLGDAEFVRELGERYGVTQQELLADPEMRAVFLPILRADLTVVETYEFVEGRRLQLPMMAFAGAEDVSVSDVGLQRWGEVTEAAFEARRLTGGHFFTLEGGEGQKDLLETIGRRLSR